MVAAYVLHKRPLKASIVQEGISMGRTVHIMPPKVDHPRTKPWIERHIMYCLAGLTAEKLLAPEHWEENRIAIEDRSAGDIDEAQEYVSGILTVERPSNAPYVGSVDAYWSWMQARTDALIVRKWGAVTAVAQELLAYKELTEQRLRRVIGTALRMEAP